MVKKPGLLYWAGLVQTDGHIRLDKKGEIRAIEFNNDNMRLMTEFCKTCKDLFEVYPKINKRKDRNSYYAGIYTVENKISVIKGIDFNDPPKPPEISKLNNKIFGAYLAGVIDGDGDVRIKRKNYPQCVIRITSGKSQEELKNSIEMLLNCKVSITRRQRFREGKQWKKWYALEFYVSYKNSNFIEKYILPYLLSKHKSGKLKTFLNK